MFIISTDIARAYDIISVRFASVLLRISLSMATAVCQLPEIWRCTEESLDVYELLEQSGSSMKGRSDKVED